jgi:hypothetical protein
MATEIGKEVPSFAEIQDMHANRPDVFEKTLKGLVSMQDRVTEGRKEVTKTVNFLAQGKLVCLAWKDYIAAVKLKTTTSDFDRYFRARFGGRIPGAGWTLASAFSAHCLALETAARYVPESVFDGHYCRVLQAAGKIVKIAGSIIGETPETSGLNHQVFTDVAKVLNTGFKNALQDLRDIEARLVWEVKMEDIGEEGYPLEVGTRTLRYLSVEEMASRRAKGTC